MHLSRRSTRPGPAQPGPSPSENFQRDWAGPEAKDTDMADPADALTEERSEFVEVCIVLANRRMQKDNASYCLWRTL